MAVLLGASACGGSASDRAAAGLTPMETPVLAVPERVLVVPVAVEGPMPANGRVSLGLASSGGTVPVSVEGEVFWIGAAQAPPERGGAIPFELAWLGPAGVWTATPASASARPASVGTWAIVAKMPAMAGSSMMRLDDRAFPIQWASLGPVPGFGHQRGSEPGIRTELLRESEWLRRALGKASRSPASRWRARLVEANLGMRGPATLALFPDRVIEALAMQSEGLWSAGLSRLQAIDPDLALRLRWRLGTVLSFDEPMTGSAPAAGAAGIGAVGGPGIAAPAWQVEGAGLAPLLRDLTDSTLPPTEVAARARGWLDLQPPALVWVIDDCGAGDGVTRPLRPSIGIANLTMAPMVVGIPRQTGAGAPDLVTVPPVGVTRLLLQTPLVHTGPPIAGLAPLDRSAVAESRTTTVELRVGDIPITRVVAARALRVSPPGLSIGPLRPDWTMSGWMSIGAQPADEGADRVPDARMSPDWATGVLLSKDQQAPSILSGAFGRSVMPDELRAARWVVYVECRRPRSPGLPEPSTPVTNAPAAPEPESTLGHVSRSESGGGQVSSGSGGSATAAADPIERVTVYLGAYERSIGVYSVAPDGSFFDLTRASAAGGEPRAIGRVPVRVGADRWSCWIPVPPGCIERGTFVHLGITRTDARGVRTAWPRAMMPWQREPGRAVVDMSAWPEPQN
ncbi:MAG: hypothetical protein KF745_05255 [Phycisphaeraceae bacterium]|nr:hypothetical protein [Phycisphaeraceae bacterium]